MRGQIDLKPINLLSLVNAYEKLTPSVFKLYREHFDIKIKEDEIEDLHSLVKELLSVVDIIKTAEGFYVGYKINQINKEFDLLRFGEESIINIELKRKSTEEKMKKQLLSNKHYLSIFGKKILQFTYVASDQKVYYLNEKEEFQESDIEFLFKQIIKQKLIEIENINKEFDPCNYLVSPFNSTEDFIENQYFLTELQDNYKKEMLNLSTEEGPCYIAIEGAAGTGKTLLAYDMAKEYRNNSKRVLIIHCGSLNDGHKRLMFYDWEITGIKFHEDYDLDKYNLIIIDEIQRIRKHQLEDLLLRLKDTNAKCIFSYDPEQCLASWEVENDIPQFLKEEVSPKRYPLTKKIRTNKEIAAFITNLFDLSKSNANQTYSNISMQYFENGNKVKDYIKDLTDTNKDWKAINYTPGFRVNYPYEVFQNGQDESAHEVIGQEFDNVIVVIDSNFTYNKNLLTSKNDYRYSNIKMLYQMVTRARKKLHIIIIDNEAVLEKCLEIMQFNKRGKNQKSEKIMLNKF
ncbi:DNA/RNA helicase domain-containing protein [Bacillus albus]|uniref:DNA/RNA helicase domain-containing protein n=1 Tax=Bacillus albus TaxID=2026189 RepID=UPI0032EF08B0